MDVSVRYVDPAQENVISLHNWGQLWSNPRQGSHTMGNLVADLGSALEDALVLLSSAPPLDGSEVLSPQNDEELAELMAKDKALNMASDEQSSFGSSNLACDSIMSSRTTMKLISAMKGSREKQGLQISKLSVTWAPDVYDPPATSQSHAVKSHNQKGSGTYKKNYRNKHKNKGKSQKTRKFGWSSTRAGGYQQ